VHAHRTIRRPKSVRLGVQALEARDVPATLDITFVGAEATANGAVFRQAAAGPEEQFETFLRLRDNNGSSEEGYNTDARPFQFDQRGGLAITHSLQLSEIPTVTEGGVEYREFVLHVAEGARNPRVSLEQLRFFVGETGDLTGYNRNTRQLSGLSAVWDLDTGSNNTVVFRDRLEGTGKGDAVVLIPNSAFAGATDSSFIYLYSRFGGQFDTHGGAEEWGVRPVEPPSEEGGSLSGFVYVTLDGDEFREPDGVPAETSGLSGVEITLSLGGQVVATTTTDTNGFYTFTGLAAGEYTITRGADPAGFFDGLNQVGSAGGTSQESNSDPEVADLIFDIDLGTDVAGIEYNFGMIEAGPPA
jgi:hypothetical protein